MNDQTTSSIRLAVTGASGKMSSRLRTLADADERFILLDELGRRERETHCSEDVKRLGAPDGVIDFTTPRGTPHALAIARDSGSALLVGTTGLTRENLDNIEEVARSNPVMIAPNTSFGAALMDHVVGRIARALKGRWDIDLLERHHVHKRDAPSGTARRLLDTIRRESGVELTEKQVHCIRAGDIAGDHEIEFQGLGENLKIFHKVTDRDVFARGALDAMAWLIGRPNGLYGINEVLGLPDEWKTE